jgi:hypothetical protein
MLRPPTIATALSTTGPLGSATVHDDPLVHARRGAGDGNFRQSVEDPAKNFVVIMKDGKV